MKRERPPRGESGPFITGGDWSVGFNSPTSLAQAELLGILGRRLREDYEPVVHEPLPESLGTLVEQLERQFDEHRLQG